MKNGIFTLLFVAQQSLACEVLSIYPVRKDVEAMFSGQPVAGLAEKYPTSAPVERTDESEYKEESPTETRIFTNVQELATSFLEMREYVSNMIIPDRFVCNLSSCIYELPERTLHHGVYLVGLDASQVAGCFRLIRVTIHRG